MPEKLPNVYENLTEAIFRLNGTIVMYDHNPYRAVAITNHKDDGIFRVYIEPTIYKDGEARPYPPIQHVPSEHKETGNIIDKWLETDEGKKSGILRKRMDSKYFDRFRPFPLGMCNLDERCLYVEWSPLRSQHQGLTQEAIVVTMVSLTHDKKPRNPPVLPVNSPAFHECIRGEHPDAISCLEALKDPSVRNEAHAFDRRFALVRGPIDMIFLAYKTDIIGALPKSDFECLRLGRKFGYCKEVVTELGLFENIIT